MCIAYCVVLCGVYYAARVVYIALRVFCVVYDVLWIAHLCITHCVIYMMYCVYCVARYHIGCVVCDLYFVLHYVLHVLLCIMYVHCVCHSPCFALCIVSCVLCIARCDLCVVYVAMSVLHFVLCVMYCACPCCVLGIMYCVWCNVY